MAAAEVIEKPPGELLWDVVRTRPADALDQVKALCEKLKASGSGPDENAADELADADLVINTWAFKGSSALHLAAFQGDEAIVVALLDCGATIDVKDKAGRTALMAAAHEGRTEVVSLLIQRGAKLKAQDKAGLSAFNHAVSRGHVSTAAVFLEDLRGDTAPVPAQLGCNGPAGLLSLMLDSSGRWPADLSATAAEVMATLEPDKHYPGAVKLHLKDGMCRAAAPPDWEALLGSDTVLQGKMSRTFLLLQILSYAAKTPGVIESLGDASIQRLRSILVEFATGARAAGRLRNQAKALSILFYGIRNPAAACPLTTPLTRADSQPLLAAALRFLATTRALGASKSYKFAWRACDAALAAALPTDASSAERLVSALLLATPGALGDALEAAGDYGDVPPRLGLSGSFPCLASALVEVTPVKPKPRAASAPQYSIDYSSLAAAALCDPSFAFARLLARDDGARRVAAGSAPTALGKALLAAVLAALPPPAKGWGPAALAEARAEARGLPPHLTRTLAAVLLLPPPVRGILGGGGAGSKREWTPEAGFGAPRLAALLRFPPESGGGGAPAGAAAAAGASPRLRRLISELFKKRNHESLSAEASSLGHALRAAACALSRLVDALDPTPDGSSRGAEEAAAPRPAKRPRVAASSSDDDTEDTGMAAWKELCKPGQVLAVSVGGVELNFNKPLLRDWLSDNGILCMAFDQHDLAVAAKAAGADPAEVRSSAIGIPSFLAEAPGGSAGGSGGWPLLPSVPQEETPKCFKAAVIFLQQLASTKFGAAPPSLPSEVDPLHLYGMAHYLGIPNLMDACLDALLKPSPPSSADGGWCPLDDPSALALLTSLAVLFPMKPDATKPPGGWEEHARRARREVVSRLLRAAAGAASQGAAGAAAVRELFASCVDKRTVDMVTAEVLAALDAHCPPPPPPVEAGPAVVPQQQQQEEEAA